MKRFFTLIFFVFLYANIMAQSPKNAVLLELGGHGNFYTINYERILYDIDFAKTTVQIGFAFYGKSEDAPLPFWMPVTINQMFQLQGNHFLELGIGLMLVNDGIYHRDNTFTDNYTFTNIVGRFGYRYHTPNQKWVFRASYTPIYLDSQLGGSDLVHWAGITAGYRF